MPADDYEAVIGLEVHTELNTSTKLFCGCANEFGAEPNTNVCPVCLGLPGSLPVLNAAAVDCRAAPRRPRSTSGVPAQSLFARKNYFYPDMPKDFQISQYEEPILADGTLDVDGTRCGSSGPTSRRTRASPSTSAAAGGSTRPTTPSSTTTGPGSRSWRS